MGQLSVTHVVAESASAITHTAATATAAAAAQGFLQAACHMQNSIRSSSLHRLPSRPKVRYVLRGFWVGVGWPAQCSALPLCEFPACTYTRILTCVCHPAVRACLQAVNGGSPTWFGITVPFDLNTLLAIVSGRLASAGAVHLQQQLRAPASWSAH